MTGSLSIALAQLAASPSSEQLEHEVKKIKAQFRGVDLIVFPELHLTNPDQIDTDHLHIGPVDTDSALHEPLNGERGKRLANIARQHGVWLIPGSVFEADGGNVFNTLPVYSPTGELVTSYRKIFPWRPYEGVKPGREFVYFDIPDKGRIGLTICYDAWFPEIFRHLAWYGCDAIINVVLTPTIDREHELILARANAIVNQVFIASVNAATPSGVGQSLIVDPEGRVRSRAAGAEPCIVTDVLHLDTTKRIQADGTSGLNCLWKQFDASDEPLELPLYEGRITPKTWDHRDR